MKGAEEWEDGSGTDEIHSLLENWTGIGAVLLFCKKHILKMIKKRIHSNFTSEKTVLPGAALYTYNPAVRRGQPQGHSEPGVHEICLRRQSEQKAHACERRLAKMAVGIGTQDHILQGLSRQ